MYKKSGQPKEYKGFFGKHKLAIASTTLVGTVVGAGILGIPYIISRSGFLIGFILIVLIGLAFLFLNLFMGEVVLRTKTQHQLTGYAEKYLGKWGKRLMTLSMMIGIYGALIAYLIGEGEALYSIFGIGNQLIFALIFFVMVAFIIYRGVKATGKAELILISLLFLVVLVIGFLSYDKIDPHNLTTINLKEALLPFGVIIFAFIGSASIPELQEELGKNKKKMKKAIIIGSILPIILYIIFSLIIIGIVGLGDFEVLEPNQRIATVALSIYASPFLGKIANFLAVLAMFTSFLTLGIALSEIYQYDYHLSRKKALLLTFIVPLVVYLFKLTNFITVLGLTGALAGGLDGILIVLMYWKAKIKGNRRPEYQLKPYKILGTVLILMFVFGIIYQTLIQFF